MLTLLSLILGFASSSLPSIMRFYTNKTDQAHELNIMKVQMDMARLNYQEELAEIKTNADSQQLAELYQNYNIGNKFIDMLNGSVRPVISYLLIGMYVFAQYVSFSQMSSDDFAIIGSMWSESDHCLLSAVISFYFGNNVFNNGNNA